MKEYIERDALMLRIKEIHCAECDSYNGLRCRACLVDDALDYIDSEPAADVEPVRHGEWRKSGPLLECQSCGELYSRLGGNAGKLWNYCPNCGARMTEDIDEQKK